MKDSEHNDYFDARFCFHGDEDKVVAILDSYAQNQIDLANINKVFELYHTIFPDGQKKNTMSTNAEL